MPWGVGWWVVGDGRWDVGGGWWGCPSAAIEQQHKLPGSLARDRTARICT